MTDPTRIRNRWAVALMLAALPAVTSVLTQQPAQARPTPDARNDYVLFRANSDSSVIAGTLDGWRYARTLRKGREAMLYGRRGGNAYIVRDPATLRQAETILAPQSALGDRQSVLGDRQEVLGAKQERLGAEQERLARRLVGMGARDQDAALTRRQTELSAEQTALGRQQTELGAQQEAMGREQRRLANEADVKLGALIDDAIRRGIAIRVQ